MVTLAPERTTPAIIRALSDAGVIVSAGHTNATYEELQPALDAGRARFHAPVQCHVAAQHRANPAPSARRSRTRTAGSGSSSMGITCIPKC